MNEPCKSNIGLKRLWDAHAQNKMVWFYITPAYNLSKITDAWEEIRGRNEEEILKIMRYQGPPGIKFIYRQKIGQDIAYLVKFIDITFYVNENEHETN